MSADFIQRLKSRLANINLTEPEKTAYPEIPASNQNNKRSIVINDAGGDVTNAGLDILSLDITDSFFTYDFELTYNGPPDLDAIAIISIDLDQNLATGEFPAPLGLGPGTFDIGAEYNIIMDIGNFFGDTLGIPASAIVLVGGDTSLTPVGLPWALSFSGNKVSVNLLKALFPIVDSDLNVAAISAGLSGLALPDLAPDYGHGLRGTESGVSWMAQSGPDGNSAVPFTASIAPGDSLDITNRAVSVSPNGSYSATILINNNSSNAPNLTVPVTMQIGAPAIAIIAVDPGSISDTLAPGSPAANYTLSISNTGNGLLVYFVSDSTDEGSWLQISGLPAGQVAPSSSTNLTVTIDPSGLINGQSYSGSINITSNDSSQSNITVPVELYIGNPTTIDPTPGQIAESVILHANYPNPFNPQTTIEFQLQQPSVVKLEIFDALGRHIKTIAGIDREESLPAGLHRYVWDGTDSAGKSVSSGQYFYRLKTGDKQLSRPMTLTK